ncbi:MAG: 3-deoxy-D-manno-octulosonic acid transferase, partial [Muribaculaceae bacterium]|nr:3-deoxy-D-manno-octulosonic acid transferase [Muribaculaceae bacterium]
MGAYGLGIKVASVRNTKAAQMTAGHREVWNRLQKGLEPGARYIWVHAASLGEFEQGRPLIERIKRERPEYKILLTFFSPSGYEIRKNYNKADLICYLPIDTAANARRFVETVRPEKAVFVKYEFWRNYLRQLNVHTIPTYLISGIFLPQQRFFKRGGSWYRAWLRWFDRLFVQDRRSAELLASVGIDRVTVAGDTRFDRVADIRDSARRHPLLDRFAGWKGEISHSTPV